MFFYNIISTFCFINQGKFPEILLISYEIQNLREFTMHKCHLNIDRPIQREMFFIFICPAVL